MNNFSKLIILFLTFCVFEIIYAQNNFINKKTFLPVNNILKIDSLPIDYTNFKILKNNLEINPSLYNKLKNEFNISQKAFNAGLLYIVPSEIKIDVMEKFNYYFTKYGEISKYGEQSLLNLVFCDQWYELPFYYNFYSIYNSVYNMPKSVIKCSILHFSGDIKPWNPESVYYDEWMYNSDPNEIVLENNNIKIIDIIILRTFIFLSFINPINLKKNISWFIGRYFPALRHFIKNYI